MARKPSLNVESLIELGARKLAELILDEAKANAPFRKRANAALAGAQGAEAVAALIDRRLAALEKARSMVDWRKERDFAGDLRATADTILGELAALDAVAAFARLVRFLASHGDVFGRVDDSSGRLQNVYWGAAERTPELLGKMTTDALAGVPAILAAALNKDTHDLVAHAAILAVPVLPEAAIGEFDATLARAAGHEEAVISIRQAIADKRGDIDAYVALEARRSPYRCDPLRVAEKLLEAKRFEEALAWVRRGAGVAIGHMSEEDLPYGRIHYPRELARATLEARILTAKGDRKGAQSLRWATFEKTLDVQTLRDYVAALDDFQEFEELDRALAVVEASRSPEAALGFFVAWPRLDRAAKLVMAKRGKWEGRYYGVLSEAASALEGAHPDAAVVLYRALVDGILGRGNSAAYGHGARYLARLADLAEADDAEDHAGYLAGLKKSYGRKYGFWSAVEEAENGGGRRARAR
jgi:hypothetical protein